jgi:hypothetical protein
VAYDQTEQRIRLGTLPEESLVFDVAGTGARESQIIGGEAWRNQDRLIAVPLWQYASRTTGALVGGDVLIPIMDAQQVPYVEGEFAMLFESPMLWELVRVLTVSGSGLAIDGTVFGSWPAGTRVYPARRARLTDNVRITRGSSSFISGVVEFVLERGG